MSAFWPTLPADIADGVSGPLRIKRPVRAEEELQAANATGHLVGWRTLRRHPFTFDRDPDDVGTSPDGDSESVAVGPWLAAPFATHIAVEVAYEAAADGASLTPLVEFTLQRWTGAAWEDVDAPDGEGGGPGVELDEADLTGGDDVSFEAATLDGLADAPSAYPTGPRALIYSDDVETGALLRLIVDADSVRLWSVVVLEQRDTATAPSGAGVAVDVASDAEQGLVDPVTGYLVTL